MASFYGDISESSGFVTENLLEQLKSINCSGKRISIVQMQKCTRNSKGRSAF